MKSSVKFSETITRALETARAGRLTLSDVQDVRALFEEGCAPSQGAQLEEIFARAYVRAEDACILQALAYLSYKDSIGVKRLCLIGRDKRTALVLPIDKLIDALVNGDARAIWAVSKGQGGPHVTRMTFDSTCRSTSARAFLRAALREWHGDLIPVSHVTTWQTAELAIARTSDGKRIGSLRNALADVKTADGELVEVKSVGGWLWFNSETR